jgi:hypothetical protein
MTWQQRIYPVNQRSKGVKRKEKYSGVGPFLPFWHDLSVEALFIYLYSLMYIRPSSLAGGKPPLVTVTQSKLSLCILTASGSLLNSLHGYQALEPFLKHVLLIAQR